MGLPVRTELWESGGGRGFLQHVPVQLRGTVGVLRDGKAYLHGQLTASPACPLPFPDVSPDNSPY